MVREKSFYKTFFAMATVLILQNVLTFSVNLADNIMLGGYSEVSLSGAAAVNQIQFVYQSLLSAAGEAAVILGSQYFGKGRVEPVKRVAAAAVRLGLGLCLLFFALVSLFPRFSLSLFTESDAIISEGLLYLRLVRWTYPFFALTQVLLGVLRSVGSVRIALGLAASTLTINCEVNYTLIYGHFGAPRLGVAGAAVGTLVSRAVELLILVVFILKKEKVLRLRPADLTRTEKALTRDYCRVAAPILLVSGLWGLNTAAQNAIMGHVSDSAFTANSAASPLFLLVKSGAIGASSAAGFLIGKTVGEGDVERVKKYAVKLQLLYPVIGLVCSALHLILRGAVIGLYDVSADTRAMATVFINILAVTIIGSSYEAPALTGIVSGGGDTKFVLINDLIFMWGLVLPASALSAFVFRWPVPVTFFILKADQLLKCFVALVKVNRFRWIRDLTVHR